MQCPNCQQPVADASKFCNQCGQPLPLSMPPAVPVPVPATPVQQVDAFIGRQFGNYHIISLLGEGGFAKVYRGEHIHLGTQAAIKLLHTQLADAEDMAKFREEARTIARLDHPRIVRVLDFGVEGHLPYLAMAYAPNGSLRLRHPRGTQLPIGLVLLYVKHISEALQYAHEQKLIHRDIKPENMLLSQRNDVLLTDFGIALVAQSSRYEDTRGVAGTASYMAPEQLQGHPRPASDLYSLGIVLYEWLTGERPFQGSFTEIASQHVLTPPPLLREKVPDIPPMVEDVVLTALAKDPKERFASARALANAFEQATRDTRKSRVVPASQLPPPWPHYSTQLPPGAALRPPTDPLATSLAAVPPAVPPPIASDTPPPDQPSADWHHLPTHLSTGSSAPVEPLPSMLMPSLPPSPPLPETFSESNLAPVPKPARQAAPPQQPKAAAAPPGESAPPTGTPFCIYPGHGAEVQTLVWVQHGKQIVSGSADKTVQVWESTSGDAIFTFAGQHVVVAPNQERAATLSSDNSIHILDLTTGREVLTYRGHESPIMVVAWSPDSRQIASSSQDNAMRIWNSTSGETLDSYRLHASSVTAVAWSPDGKQVASADTDGKVRVRNHHSQTTLLTYSGQAAKVHHLLWSADGKRIISASQDGSVHIWDATTGKKVASLDGQAKTEASLALSPNGTSIASVSIEQAGTTAIQVWESATGRIRTTYRSHMGAVHAIAWSPDNQRIASAGKDGKVHIWNASTGVGQFKYEEHKGELCSVAWSPDGKRLASAGQDTKVHVWSAEPESGSSSRASALTGEQVMLFTVAGSILLIFILIAVGTRAVAFFLLGLLISVGLVGYAVSKSSKENDTQKSAGE